MRADGPRSEPFAFLEPGPLVDGELSLVLAQRHPPDPATGRVPAYEFEMRDASDPGRKAGRVSFRVAETEDVRRYAGHFGYGVEAVFRGRHFAERAVRLLLPLARRHGLSTVWITCNPENAASRRTCERLGATLVDVVPLPPGNDQYLRGDRLKCRYRLDL